MTKKVSQLWGSAFDKTPLQEVVKFCAGRDVRSVEPADFALIPYDLLVNKAHCIMLATQNIISREDAKIILKGLLEIEQLVKKGEFTLDPDKEDVHTNIESWLIENYGIDSSGKLHTATICNYQLVTDMRLYLRDQTLIFIEELNKL